MSANLDTPPLYDALTEKSQDHLSNIWLNWMATTFETLSNYLTQTGILIPILSTQQRDALVGNSEPTNGQMIYNSTTNAPQIWQNGVWKTFTTV